MTGNSIVLLIREISILRLTLSEKCQMIPNLRVDNGANKIRELKLPSLIYFVENETT